MKIKPVYAAALTLVVGAAACAQPISVTHRIEHRFVDPGSLACAVANPQNTTENSYFRSFDLTEFPQITGACDFDTSTAQICDLFDFLALQNKFVARRP